MTLKKLDATRKLLPSGTGLKDVALAIGVSVPTLNRHIPEAASV